MVPLVIIEQPSADAVDGLLSDLQGRGWTVSRGWRLPSHDWNAARLRIVCAGALRTAADAHAALVAATRGAGIVAFAETDRELVERFYEDLTRFGRVELTSLPQPRDPLDRLGSEERRLLALLAEGVSLDEAARALFISRRTAHRRLAAARLALGVRTTVQAVMRCASDGARGEVAS